MRNSWTIAGMLAFSIAAAALQEAGLIRYTHGRVTVRNRRGLKMASCECYSSLRVHFDRLRH